MVFFGDFFFLNGFFWWTLKVTPFFLPLKWSVFFVCLFFFFFDLDDGFLFT